MVNATDTQLRITADRARGERSRETGYYFNQDAYTAALRAVYELGRRDAEAEHDSRAVL